MRLCIWDERLLHFCFFIISRCRTRVHRPAFSFPPPPPSMVHSEWQMASLGSCCSKLNLLLWQTLSHSPFQRAKGLPLIILIRISPFPPWVYSNSLFAVGKFSFPKLYHPANQIIQSIQAVSLWQFVTATLFVFPKLVLHAFIGSRIAALSDGDRRSHMDTRKALVLTCVCWPTVEPRHKDHQCLPYCGWTDGCNLYELVGLYAWLRI